jgi:hypothetical protein
VDDAIVCYMLDPKYVVINEWQGQYGIPCQLARLLETYGPEDVVSLSVHEEPDWSWWEPRYDLPYRRQQAREREFGL